MRINRESEGGVDLWVSRPDPGTSAVAMVLFFCGAGQSPEAALDVAHPWGRSLLHVAVPHRESVEIGSYLSMLQGLRSRLGFGPEQTAVVGFSEGGELALQMGLLAGSAWAATVSIGGTGPSLQATDAASLRRARDRNFFLLHGVRDTVAPVEISRALFRALSEHGGRVEFAELPMAHEISPVAVGAIRGYLMSVLESHSPHSS